MQRFVAQRGRPQQRVGDRMEQRVGVGVSEESGLVGNLDAAQNQLAARDQLMDVISLPDPKVHFRPLSIIAAKARSAG